MSKEPYVKPEVKSEILEPEVLYNTGSPTGNNNPGGGCGDFGGGCDWGGC